MYIQYIYMYIFGYIYIIFGYMWRLLYYRQYVHSKEHSWLKIVAMPIRSIQPFLQGDPLLGHLLEGPIAEAGLILAIYGRNKSSILTSVFFQINQL